MRSDVGLAVGEKDDAIDGFFVFELTQFFCSFGDACEQGGRTTRGDFVDGVVDEFLVGELGGRDKDFDDVVIGDNGDGIIALESGDGDFGSVASAGDFFAAHRAGAVEDDGDVDGGAFLKGGCFSAGDADFEVGGLLFTGRKEGVAKLALEAQRGLSFCEAEGGCGKNREGS